MARHVCFHCGEHYDASRLVCPHCGAEKDFTYAETPPEVQGWDKSDDAQYQEFLEREGLARAKPAIPPRKALVWGVLLTLAISGLILLLL